jgi:hypothetical protein
LLGRAPQARQELLGNSGFERKRSTNPHVEPTVLPPSPTSAKLSGLRRKITSEGLPDGTIVECHDETSDKWCESYFYIVIIIIVIDKF